MNAVNNDELTLIKEINSNQIINSTLDITDNSVLFINNQSKEKLEKLISEEEYELFFKKALKKFGVSSPAELKTAEKKKEFFNYIDDNFKAKNEKD